MNAQLSALTLFNVFFQSAKSILDKSDQKSLNKHFVFAIQLLLFFESFSKSLKKELNYFEYYGPN